MAGQHRMGHPRMDGPTLQLAPAHRAPVSSATRMKRGLVVGAMSLAVVVAGLGFVPHDASTKGAADTSPATPPASVEATPTPPEVTPDAAMVDPPVLTPALPHSHRSRLARSDTARVLAVGSQGPVASVPAVNVQTPTATPAPVQAPVETPVAAPVPVQTYRTYTPVQTYPTYSYQTYRQYPSYSTTRHHHHYSRDLDQDGDNK